jgi:hypothetical protein
MGRRMSDWEDLRDLCDFNLRLSRSNQENEVSCHADLRISAANLQLGDNDCTVAISQAKLKMQVEGFSEVFGTRFGEPKRNNEVILKYEGKSIREQALSGKAGLSFEISELKAKLGIGAGVNISSDKLSRFELVSTDQIEFLRVCAKPNFSWIVSELRDDQSLEATYLSNDCLIRLQLRKNANRRIIKGEILVAQRDIRIEAHSGSLSKSTDTNKRRLMDILIAKSLSETINYGSVYLGVVKIAEVSVEFEDDERDDSEKF